MIVGKRAGKGPGKKIDATEKGEGGHRGKLQREDYRQLGYQATMSLLALASKRAIHRSIARELFVLRRIGNIIIGVIASQKPKPHAKGVMSG